PPMMPSFLPLGQDSLTMKASCAGLGMPTAKIRSVKMPPSLWPKWKLCPGGGRWPSGVANQHNQ
ncbi:hypothetical protein Ddye_026570, partial [Dipteronia dyeriana]